MKYEINNEIYDVAIEKKNNKNLYIRVKEDLTILVTTNIFTSDFAEHADEINGQHKNII